MLYVDDKLPRHPKIFRAGSMLGPNGAALALAMFLDGLSYAREHLTDGYIPDNFVASSPLVQRGLDVARVLVDRRVRLWHRVRGGYQIHDYHDWNKSASEIKEIREKWKKKKAGQRRNGNGHFTGVSHEVSPGDAYRDSRVRDPRSTIHVGGRTRLVPYGIDSTKTAAGAAVLPFANEKKPISHRVLCAMAGAEFDADPAIDYSSWVEAVKLRVARQGYAYPEGSQISDALEAVTRARARQGGGRQCR